MTFFFLRRRTIVKVSFDGVRVFPVGPLSICLAWQYIFRLSEGLCFTARLLFFLITYPGIEVMSRLFRSNSVDEKSKRSEATLTVQILWDERRLKLEPQCA